ncbi:MAG: glycosyltransferase [Anaerolineae bacterium]|nr:glycosyltransferase [Anaerolineae bacterium]
MNILILTEKVPPAVGGLAVSTRRLACGLAQTGQAVTVSALDASLPPGIATTGDDEGVPVLRLGPHRRTDDTLAGWFDQVVALHVAQNLDLIHALYITQPAFVAVTAARYLGRPSVISARGNDLDRTAFDPGKFSQILWALQHADAVTAVSTDLVRKVQVFAPGRQVFLVPNGVDAERFAPGPRDAALANSLELDGGPVVAFVGEARRKKGLSVLLAAFARLCAACDPPPILFLVGGVRRDDAPIVEVFCRQNPALKVRVVPNVAHEQLPAYYRLADILVLPSLRDGLPNALLEGMACERAVVASDVGGIPDVVRDQETGLLVRPGDADALTEAMLTLLSDPARRERLGRAARAVVATLFTPGREIERNRQVYDNVKGEG